MINLGNFTISQKLGGLVVGLLALFILLGVFAWSGIRTIDKQLIQVVDVEAPTSSAAYEMDVNMLRVVIAVLGYLEQRDQSHVERAQEGFNGFKEFHGIYQGLAESDKGKSLGNEADRKFAQMEKTANDLIEIQDEQDKKFNDFLDLTEEMEEIIDTKLLAGLRADNDQAFEKRELIAAVEAFMDETGRNLANFLRTKDEKYKALIKEDIKGFDDNMRQYEALSLITQERRGAEELKSSYKEASQLAMDIFDHAGEKEQLLDNFVVLRRDLGNVVLYDGIVKGIAEKDMLQSEQDAKNAVKGANRNIIILLILGIVFGAALGTLLSNSITKPLGQAVSVADQISEGDLNVDIDVTAKDETGKLLNSMKKMVAYIREIADIAESVAEGDLKVDVRPRSNEDVLSHSFGKMVNNLRSIVEKITNSSATVASAAVQLSESSMRIRSGAEEQASATDETSATIEEMATSLLQVAANADNLSANVTETSASIEQVAASIQSVAKNASDLMTSVDDTSSTIEEMAASIEQVAVNSREVNKSSESAVKEANDGKSAVEKTVDGMQQIADTMKGIVSVIEKLDESSKKINSIVDVIDDIAEQTNLLALNAAIEAARAGEHGRGFAVVADEVRKLAERSASSAKEIVELISDVQTDTEKAIKVTGDGYQKATEGVDLASRAGIALEKIAGTITTVNRMMTEVSKVTDQQAKASDRIVKTVENMRRMTQQVNNATREQATSSKQIMKAVEVMNAMTTQVKTATSEQKRAGEQVVKAIDNIANISAQNKDVTVQLVSATENLRKQGDELKQITTTFNI